MNAATPPVQQDPIQSATGPAPDIPSPVAWRPAAQVEQLMPYEAVAKAIFVKANGLPAYHLATRFIRWVP